MQNNHLPKKFYSYRLTIPQWSTPPHVRAVFSKRYGGISSTPYDGGKAYPKQGFNLGFNTGDQIECVEHNRQQLLFDTGVDQIAWLNQVHGTHVVQADEVINAAQQGISINADASISNIPYLACAVLSADCLPILLCHQHLPIVSAIHAGWKGLAKGVIERTVEKICHDYQVDAKDLLSYIGPAIGPTQFEVDKEVMQTFLQAAHPLDLNLTKNCFIANAQTGKYLANLFYLARIRLQSLGIIKITCEEICTFSHPELFYSYRRDQITGRMASLIWLAK